MYRHRDFFEFPLESGDIYKYRHCAGIARFMVNGRPDIGFAVREVGKSLKEPRPSDMKRLKRLARYAEGRPRMVKSFVWQKDKSIADCKVFTALYDLGGVDGFQQ